MTLSPHQLKSTTTEEEEDQVARAKHGLTMEESKKIHARKAEKAKKESEQASTEVPTNKAA